MKIRVLRTGFNDAYFNMGLDEAILMFHDNSEFDATLRLYEWKPSAVSIGYFQCIKEEVDIEKCKELNVDIVRRLTGGGAVYHDTEVTYSFVSKIEKVNKDLIESYRQICGGVILGLKELGIETEFIPINDIISGGRKISGNAQTRKEGKILQHGTILTEVDVDKMFSLLKVSDEKLKDKIITAVKDRVTSVNNITSRKTNFEEIEDALVKGFKNQFNAEIIQDKPSKEELKIAKEKAEERFKSKEWTFLR